MFTFVDYILSINFYLYIWHRT